MQSIAIGVSVSVAIIIIVIVVVCLSALVVGCYVRIHKRKAKDLDNVSTDILARYAKQPPTYSVPAFN